MRLIRFGQDDDCVVFDADDIAWIRIDSEQSVISVMLKCGQQFAVYRKENDALFENLSLWATSLE